MRETLVIVYVSDKIISLSSLSHYVYVAGATKYFGIFYIQSIDQLPSILWVQRSVGGDSYTTFLALRRKHLTPFWPQYQSTEADIELLCSWKDCRI